MKYMVSLCMFAIAVAAINATCLYCNNNNDDHQEIKYENLKSWDVAVDQESQYIYEPKNVAEKFRVIQKVIQKYPLYVQKAKQNPKFSDPLNLIDATEIFANGDIQYKNAFVNGLHNVIFNDIDFDDADKNLFSVYATLKKAEVAGDYFVANFNESETGQFYITLRDVEFKAKFFMDKFMEFQPQIDRESITFGNHESVYTNEEVMKQLNFNDNAAEVSKPYIFYYNYLNQIIKARLANEMAVSFAPLIAKRFEQTISKFVLFPTEIVKVPKANTNIAPGIQATVYDAVLRDMWTTANVQKLTNYTVDNEGQTEFLFCFTWFDLKGNNKWALEYNTGNMYKGRASFVAGNVQTVMVATKPNGQEKISLKFVKTEVNELTMLLDTDENCETIRYFVQQRIPKVLEHSLKTFMSQKSEMALKNQIALIGEKYQY